MFKIGYKVRVTCPGVVASVHVGVITRVSPSIHWDYFITFSKDATFVKEYSYKADELELVSPRNVENKMKADMTSTMVEKLTDDVVLAQATNKLICETNSKLAAHVEELKQELADERENADALRSVYDLLLNKSDMSLKEAIEASLAKTKEIDRLNKKLSDLRCKIQSFSSDLDVSLDELIREADKY